MKINSHSKVFGAIALCIFLLAIMASGVSATSTLTASPLIPFTNTGQYQTLTISGNGSNTNFTSPSYTYFSLNPVGNIHNVSFAKYNISLNTIPSVANYGDLYSKTLNFTAYNNTLHTPVTLSYIKSFCSNGDQNDTGLTMYVTLNNNGNGASNTQWQPLDPIDVQVELSNSQSQDLSNVYFVIGLVKAGSNNNVAGSLNWLSGSQKVQVGNIASGDNYKYNFQFRVNPDITAGSYRLFIKAYSADSGENKLCIDHSSDLSNYGSSSYYADISVSSPPSSKSVVVDPSSVPSSTTAKCSQQVTVTPKIYNIGSRDFKNQIFVRLYNSELGLNMNQTLYGNMNSGDGIQSPFSFTVPLNATEKTYSLSLVTYYGYNENNNGYYVNGNYYQYVSDNIFTIPLTVSGGCVYATPATTQVQAQLQSGGKAGEPLVISATLENTGTKTVNYNLGLEGYTNWATLSSMTPSNITLAPGQSQNIMINMNINKDATGGNKQFSLNVYSNGYLIKQQPLSLSVTARFWNSITGGSIGVQNVGLWAFNIILILAIIVVLVIVLRRRK